MELLELIKRLETLGSGVKLVVFSSCNHVEHELLTCSNRNYLSVWLRHQDSD